MDPHEWEFTREFQQEVVPRIFSPEHAIKLQQFEWSLVQNNTSSAPKKDSPMQIWCMGTQGPKDFLQDKQSLESNYDPHLYLLRG